MIRESSKSKPSYLKVFSRSKGHTASTLAAKISVYHERQEKIADMIQSFCIIAKNLSLPGKVIK
jgi:hypothetical protein